MVMQIPRSEYNRMKKHQYAGSRSALGLTAQDVARHQAENPGWKGMHWYMYNGGSGVCLAYVNVVADGTEIASEDLPPNLR